MRKSTTLPDDNYTSPWGKELDVGELGYGIGSGAVESAHKQVVHARLRQAGMRWSENGARRLLALRLLLLNHDWVFRAMEQILIDARCSRQNSFAERVVGSIRRECLDHVVVLNEAHLRWLLRSYFAYYHRARTHLSLDEDSPETGEIEPPNRGHTVEIQEVGGLHHRSTRRAA